MRNLSQVEKVVYFYILKDAWLSMLANCNIFNLFVQESYSLLAKYQISVAREEADKVDTFRFAWQKLNTLAVSTSSLTLYSCCVYTQLPRSNFYNYWNVEWECACDMAYVHT